MFPWLTFDEVQEALTEVDAVTPTTSGSAAASTDPVPAEAAVPKGDDELVASAMERLYALREEFAESDEELEDGELHFYNWIAGGEWLAKTKGKIADQSVCKARAHAKLWATKFGWPKQRGFAFGKFGGEHNSWMLSGEWARLGEHYFQAWIDAGTPWDLVYTDEHDPPERLEFLDWCATILPENEVIWRAIHEVRIARPVAGAG